MVETMDKKKAAKVIRLCFLNADGHLKHDLEYNGDEVHNSLVIAAETLEKEDSPEEAEKYIKGYLDACEKVQDIMRESESPEKAYQAVAEFLHQKMEEGGRNF